MRTVDLHWLPVAADLSAELRRTAGAPRIEWQELVRLANLRLDFLQTHKLDKTVQQSLAAGKTQASPWRALKLAILSSSTSDHLLPALRVGALRRNLQLQTFTGDYGMYLQELQQETSALVAFKPDVVLFSFHAQHLIGTPHPALPAALCADSRKGKAPYDQPEVSQNECHRCLRQSARHHRIPLAG